MHDARRMQSRDPNVDISRAWWKQARRVEERPHGTHCTFVDAFRNANIGAAALTLQNIQQQVAKIKIWLPIPEIL